MSEVTVVADNTTFVFHNSGRVTCNHPCGVRVQSAGEFTTLVTISDTPPTTTTAGIIGGVINISGNAKVTNSVSGGGAAADPKLPLRITRVNVIGFNTAVVCIGIKPLKGHIADSCVFKIRGTTPVVVIVKPDGVKRNLIKVVRDAYVDLYGDKSLIKEHIVYDNLDILFEQHYEEHKDKPFYGDLVAAMARGPVYVMMFNVPDCPESIKGGRDLMKRLREVHGIDTRNNTVHMSDSVEAGIREMDIWF